LKALQAQYSQNYKLCTYAHPVLKWWWTWLENV